LKNRRLGEHAALLVASLLAGALLAEGGLRTLAAAWPSFGARFAAFDPLAILIEPNGTFGYRPKPHSIFRYDGARATINGMSYRGPEVVVPKPPGHVRIVLLGGSATHGWGVADDQTIDAYMREILAARYPGRAFDVINLAVDGYNSYQLVERLRTDGMRLEPDLLIVNAGVNDVANARYAGLEDWDRRAQVWDADLARLRAEAAKGHRALWTQVKHYSYVARLGGFAYERLLRFDQGRAARHATAHPEAAVYFERNLLRIADLADRRLPILFSTEPSALATRYRPHDTSTTRVYWIVDAATTQRIRDQLADRMRAAVDRLRGAGRPVRYLSHDLPPAMFLDDCHLTPAGNRRMALDFVAATAPFLARRPGTAPVDAPVTTARSPQ
jgi:lysophospholipase L1-like esterase